MVKKITGDLVRVNNTMHMCLLRHTQLRPNTPIGSCERGTKILVVIFSVGEKIAPHRETSLGGVVGAPEVVFAKKTVFCLWFFYV